MEDKWAYLRKDLFGNIEPNVILLATTQPVGHFNTDLYPNIIEKIPADAASTSYDKTIATVDASRKLNTKLINLGHLTPFESIQFNFKVSGISKACAAQMSRHRIGQGHVSLSRRYTSQKPNFIYPLLTYVNDENEAKKIYTSIATHNIDSYNLYMELRNKGITKQDARMVIPVSVATERNWFVNARALRDFLKLRLDPAAEWEIRRLAELLLSIVMHLTPSIFEDIEKKFAGHEKKA